MTTHTTKERARFWKGFSLLINNGIPILPGLEIAIDSADDLLKPVLPEIIKGIENGLSVHLAMEAHRQVFSAIEINLVQAGELGGVLDIKIEALAAALGEFSFPLLAADDKIPKPQAFADEPVVHIVNRIIADAARQNASDGHLEVYEDRLRLRYRINGTLIEQEAPLFEKREAIISRFKTISMMDVSERNLPQDGRVKVNFGKGEKMKTVDLRIATLPVQFGEKICFRLLNPSVLVNLDQLGFKERDYNLILDALSSASGMTFVTGPTGSGKTVTLYAMLQHLNKPDIHICTAEDPVEYNFFGINQVQIRDATGMTFAKALKAFLRQDPDVIMVGEIRDKETLSISAKAAITGHRVLSTMHTKNAAAGVDRLLKIGLEPFVLNDAVRLIVSQRLVRKLCPHCKKETIIQPETFRGLGLDPGEMAGRTFYESAGCDNCSHTGYRGRGAIYEVMPITPAIKRLILEDAFIDEIQAQAVSEGMTAFRQGVFDYWREGRTDLKQVYEMVMSL